MDMEHKNPRRLLFSAILVSEPQSSQECIFHWYKTLTSTYRIGPQLLSWLPTWTGPQLLSWLPT